MKGSDAESFKNRPKQRKRTRISASPCGADDQIRTGDLILTKDALYRLSYISALRQSLNAGFIILRLIAKIKR